MTSVTRTFASIIVACAAAGLGTAALAADKAQTSTAAATTQSTDWAQQRKDRIQRRLDSAATRLEVKASQQSAWQAYAAAVQALGETDAMSSTQPAKDADAASIARERADRAAAFARNLSAVADATARLQGVLSPEQKSVLNAIAREHGLHHGRGGFGPMRMARPNVDGHRSGDRRRDGRASDLRDSNKAPQR
jgi:hypothetical protein